MYTHTHMFMQTPRTNTDMHVHTHTQPHTPSFPCCSFKVTKGFKSPSQRFLQAFSGCAFFSFLSSPALSPLYWSETEPRRLPRLLHGGMWQQECLTITASLSARGHLHYQNDGVIMIMDGVYWAHKDAQSRSSAVHRFATFFRTEIPKTYQPGFTKRLLGPALSDATPNVSSEI